MKLASNPIYLLTPSITTLLHSNVKSNAGFATEVLINIAICLVWRTKGSLCVMRVGRGVGDRLFVLCVGRGVY